MRTMDLLLNVVAVFVLAIPLGFAAALFPRVAPHAFTFGRRPDLPWPVGVQEEDPESAWARGSPDRNAEATDEIDDVAVVGVRGQVGPGSSRR